MRDVARVFLTAHSTLHQSLLREMIHFCDHCLVVITKWTRERGVDLGSDLLGGRLTRLAFPLLKSVEWDHDSRQSTIGEKHAGKNYTGRVIV